MKERTTDKKKQWKIKKIYCKSRSEGGDRVKKRWSREDEEMYKELTLMKKKWDKDEGGERERRR